MNCINKIAAIAVVALIIITAAGCGSSRNNFDTLMTENTELRVYEVFGMDCPGCHGGLENLVDEIPGVIASKANWEQQSLKVIVSVETDVSDESIQNAIKQANFTPGERIE